MRITTRSLTASAVAAGIAIAGLLVPSAAHASTPANGTLLSYTTTVGGDPADVYYPQVSSGTTLPFAVLLQGANVDKSDYVNYAKLVSSFDIIVIVPNNVQYFGPTGGLYASESEVTSAAAWAATENTNTASPLYGKINTSTMGLIGHSFGGAAGLYADEDACQAPFCFGYYAPPAALKAAAFYGTNATSGPYTDYIDASVPTELINGTLDGLATPANAQTTFNQMSGAPRALVTMTGTNHYGIANANNPSGADADPNTPTTSQSLANSDIALWTAEWLKAGFGDTAAQSFVNGYGDALDGLVTVQHAG